MYKLVVLKRLYPLKQRTFWIRQWFVDGTHKAAMQFTKVYIRHIR